MGGLVKSTFLGGVRKNASTDAGDLCRRGSLERSCKKRDRVRLKESMLLGGREESQGCLVGRCKGEGRRENGEGTKEKEGRGVSLN